METQTNRYYLDGADLWLYYKVGVESGSDDLLKMPKRKESITHNWLDENGIDVDLSRVFVEAKDIELKCHIIADSEADFWENYNRLQTTLKKPGLRRLTITEFGRDFFVYYKECNIYTRFTRIKSVNKVACKFSLKLTETVPQLTEQTFIVDESTQFIIT